MKIRILLVEDDELYYKRFKAMFEGENVEIVWASSGQRGIQAFKQNPNAFAVVVIDYKLPEMTGAEVCRYLRKISPDQEFIFASAFKNLEYWEDLLETGSSGFIFKAHPPEIAKSKVKNSITKYMERTRVLGFDEHEESKIELELKAFKIIGRTPSMYAVAKDIEVAKPSPYSVLVIGETGTGKELVAQALTPSDKTLVAINCASFADSDLMESQLFGHVKGAFTSADHETKGLVMQAHNNVLFLDELHKLTLSAQAKLLRFLQEMKFRKVGDNSAKETPVNFKLIAAVQPDIRERVKDGRFLPDLIERVGSLMIEVPPLRDRLDDIEILVRKFQDDFNKGKLIEQQKQVRISTVAEMMKYSWPTNVRGLQNAVKFMLTNSKDSIAEPKDFRIYLERAVTNDMSAPAQVMTEAIGEAVNDLERRRIEEALRQSQTRKEAAQRTGLSFSTFLRKLQKLGINPEMFLIRVEP